MQPETVSASQDQQASLTNVPTPVVNEEPPPPLPGKKPTRQWDAWTHQEEENFFIALRQVGKNFEKITSRVQSKNKDQVRHYYYRLIKRMKKLLGPGFVLNAKNSKDANSAMLRWWSLLEKHSCPASKLHLKPRRFKKFVTALKRQLLKDRKKAGKKQSPHSDSIVTAPVTVATVSVKATVSGLESTKVVAASDSRLVKAATARGKSAKRKTEPRTNRNKGESSRPPRQRRKPFDGSLSAAAYKRWEKAASAGVTLVAEAAEQLERAAVGEHLERLGVDQGPEKPRIAEAPGTCTSLDAGMQQATVRSAIGELHSSFDAGLQGYGAGGAIKSGNQAAKLKLQLFPIDDFTRKAMEQDGLHPYLELTLKSRKGITSVLQHLAQKWGRSSIASGDLQLFPYTIHVKNVSASQSWTLKDSSISAGDVYAAVGKPSIFRLRYGWLQSRVAQSSNAELQKPSLPSTTSGNFEAASQDRLQNERQSDTINQSAHMPSLLANTPAISCPATEVEQVSGACDMVGIPQSNLALSMTKLQQSETTSQNICGYYNIQTNRLSTGLVNAPNHASTERNTKARATVTHLCRSLCVKDGLTNKDTEKLGNSSWDSIKCLDRKSAGPVLVEVCGTLSPADRREASCTNNGKASMSEETIPKNQKASGQNSSCSWLYEECNFPQKLWNVEDPTNNGMLLPTEMDWVDSLTNISVGELLNDVSQGEHISANVLATQAQQPMQSLDSFDAAVAAQGSSFSKVESSSVNGSQTPVWDGEDTCDAFSFQRLVSQKRDAVSLSSAVGHSSCQEVMKETTGLAAAFNDFGSLEAWKQSFSHPVTPCQEQRKSDSVSNFLQPNSERINGKRFSSQDLYWADSLGPLDLGIQTPESVQGQELLFSGDLSLGGLVGCSLDIFQGCSLQGTEPKILSAGCQLRSICNASAISAKDDCSSMMNASESLEKKSVSPVVSHIGKERAAESGKGLCGGLKIASIDTSITEQSDAALAPSHIEDFVEVAGCRQGKGCEHQRDERTGLKAKDVSNAPNVSDESSGRHSSSKETSNGIVNKLAAHTGSLVHDTVHSNCSHDVRGSKDNSLVTQLSCSSWSFACNASQHRPVIPVGGSKSGSLLNSVTSLQQ